MDTKQYRKIDWSNIKLSSKAFVKEKKQYIDMELPDSQCSDENISINRTVQQADI